MKIDKKADESSEKLNNKSIRELYPNLIEKAYLNQNNKLQAF